MTILASSIIQQSGGVYPFPTMPAPLKNEGYLGTSAANIIPHKGTLIDNIRTPTVFGIAGTGQFNGILVSSTIWSVAASNVNAACDGFMGINACWYDSVNDRLYVWGIDSASSPNDIYTAYITLETGAVTNVGNFTLGTQPSTLVSIGDAAISRTAIDSGNFTIKFSDRTVVINESTGAEVSNVASTNATDSEKIGNYTTLDGLVACARYTTATNETSYMLVTRGGISTRVPAPLPLIGNATITENIPIPWGDKVKITTSVTTTGWAIHRTFNRAQFDAWLVKIADFGGLA